MFILFRPRAERRYIDAGRVGCPLRARDAEVDTCAGCRWLVEIDTTAATPFVRCEPPTTQPDVLAIWTLGPRH